MGKRELLLALGIIVLGVVVYQVTAPPGDPNQQGFSLSRLMTEMRREIRGRPASAEGRETTRHPVADSVQEIRLAMAGGTITITGEARSDIEAELHVRSNGYDDAEAQQLVKATRLRVDEAGEIIILRVEYPREGRQTATLTLKVPARLGVRMDDKSGSLKVGNVANVGIGSARGETTISGIPGAVTVAQRGSAITLENLGSLRLTTFSGAAARISNVRGDAAFNLQSGEVQVENVSGGIEMEARNAQVRFDKIDKQGGRVRINTIGGELVMTGLRSEARIDGRQTEIRLELAGAAPIGVYSEGDEVMEVTLPKAGLRVDAIAVNGRISVGDALQAAGLTSPSAAGNGEGDARREERVSGAIFGGGPAVTLRASRGDIHLRSK